MKKNFINNTRVFLTISAVIVVVALVMQLCGVGMNFGIDFTGGSLLNYSVGEDYDVKDVSAILAVAGYTDAQITKAAPITDEIAVEEPAEEIEAVKAQLEDGSLHVFDTSAFTVFGEALPDGFEADVDTDPDYAPDTAVVSDGYYHESEFRSAPYFGLFYDEEGNGSPIDGITLLDVAF